jgi:thioredoxin-dependent peroxiredoxin
MLAVLPILFLLTAADTPMRLGVGDAAPDFTLPASNGKTVKLSDVLKTKTVALAFFPKAFTGGCTKEMSNLRDVHPQIVADAQVLGISMDNVETQTKFAESLSLPFPLLADPDGVAVKAYGVANPAGYANRVTFVIGKNGKISNVIEGKDAIDPAATVSACHPATKPAP